MKASESTFVDLIGVEGNQWHYHIPRFQREYVWKKYNWSKLLEDIYDNEPGHYMGAIICVDDSNERGPGDELIYEVVDGQQRLTSLSLMLAAIYSNLTGEALQANPSLKEDDDFIIKRNSIRQRLLKKLDVCRPPLPWGVFRTGSLTYRLRMLPSTQENNLDDYRYILSEIGLLPDMPYPKNCGNRRLHKAFTYFQKNIPKEFPGLVDLLDRIYRLSFIHILETKLSKAFLLFETLNYRGVPLSAIDIIKNKMLATLESKFQQQIDQSYEQWQRLLENLPEDQDQDRFLRQFYNAFKYDPRIKIDGIPKATGSTIIAIYESLIKKNAKDIFDKLTSKAKTYNQLIEPEKYPVSPLNTALVNLERIEAASSYTLLLYLFSLDDECLAEHNLKERLVDLLCKYYFRRNITDFPNTRDLDAINIDLIEQCQRRISEGGRINYTFVSSILLTGMGKPSSIESLGSSLADSLFYNNEGMARYALAKLNETGNTREYAPDLWSRNEKGLFVWTIEHVLPQGKNIPQEWVKMIADGDKEKAEKIQADWVHCLGNLTLTGYNSRLSNQSFVKKQEKTEANIFGNRIYIGFRNGMALNNIRFISSGKEYTLADAPEWKEEYIEVRNNVMVEMLIKMFKFDNE